MITRDRKTLWIVTLILAIAVSAYGQQPAGYVLDMQGKWILSKTGQALAKGDRLPAGASVSDQSPARSDYIVIADLNGAVMMRIDCNGASDCAKPVEIKHNAIQQQSTLTVMIDTVMNLLRGQPERYSIHRVRGDELMDGVVKIENGKIGLSEVFQKMAKGKYYIRLKSLTPSNDSKPKPASFEWIPGATPPVVIEDIRPGLYELALLEKEDNVYVIAGSRAWVLATTPGEYERAQASFKDAAHLADQWEKEASPAAARGFLRAWLDYLSVQGNK